MGPEIFIALMVMGWLLAAVALLWAMLRISHHHHHHHDRPSPPHSSHKAKGSPVTPH
jgi:type VI protein secretion system component VasK